MKNTIKSFAAVALSFVLLATLWTTALARISERATAISILTNAGTELINPLLEHNGSGLTQNLFVQIQQSARQQPNQPVQILFVKVPVLGKDIAGKDFTATSRVIYARIAAVYYDNGPNAAFSLPANLQQMVDTYTPFLQLNNLSTLSKNTNQTLPQSPLPQLPSIFTGIFASFGITPLTLTATAHHDAITRSYWLWAISGALALLLILLSTGWNRLRAIAWPLVHGSWHIAAIGIIIAVLVNRNPAQAAPFRGVLDPLTGVFMPVFYIACLIGIAGIAVSMIGNRLSNKLQTNSQFQQPPQMEYRNI